MQCFRQLRLTFYVIEQGLNLLSIGKESTVPGEESLVDTYSVHEHVAACDNNAPASKVSGPLNNLNELNCMCTFALKVNDRNSCTTAREVLFSQTETKDVYT